VRVIKGCRVHRMVAVALWVVMAFGLVLFAQADGENPGMRVTRSLSAAHALPESTFQVTLELKADTDLNGVGLREHLPFGWVIHPVENDGAAFKRSEAEWVFNETIEAGSTHYITYELTVPAAGQLMTNPLPQCFTISGTYQTTVPSFETATEGESMIEVDSSLPIGTAIAHLIPQQVAGTDIIDLRLSRWISEAQLERALELWQHDLPVPSTAGQRIDLATMNHLAAQFETCTRADDALPLSIDPELIAIRTLETFLPCDSVLLPEGCLDPGQEARLVSVHVTITPSFDAYGISLKEWMPSAWEATPIEQDGFWYRPSANEWVYPTKVHAGETIELTYQIEVIPTPYDSVEAGAGCCGQDMVLIGEASAALECSVAPVLGEDTITVSTCLPVLLAISRWDVAEDRLDVKLSDSLSIRQVQRAVEFWQQNQPVPHTCGYTVGYHTLKNIVAYWLSGTPITMPLSQDAALPSCGDNSEDCESALCLEGWICQLGDMQDPADFVGFPEPPTVVVDGGPDRVLTCNQPSVTLSALTEGGIEPFKFEWRDSSGATLGTARTLSVNTPDTYTLIAISCGGCLAVDTIIITDDFAQPQITASVNDILTGYVTSVDVTADLTGGTGPFVVTWTMPSNEHIGGNRTLSVSQPGTYGVTITGSNGCTGTAIVQVLQDIEPPAVEIDITPTLLVNAGPTDAVLTCALPEVLLVSQVSGGRSPYILQWTNSQGVVLGDTATLPVTAPEIYWLKVTGANGVSVSTSVEVGQDIEPPVVSIAVSDELTCAITEVTLTSSVSAGRAPFTYQWTNAAQEAIGSEASLTVTEPGSYGVTVTGTNGCSDRAEIIVDQDIAPPVVTMTTDGVLTCAVSEVTLAATVSGGRPPYAYAWINSAGNELGDTASVTVSEPGIYSVLVIGDNGCFTETSIAVEQDIESPLVTATVDNVLTCALTSVNLHANVVGGRPPLTFKWTNEAEQVVGTKVGIATSMAGLYTIEVTGANGCSSSDRIIVAEDVESPTISLDVSESLTCSITEVLLTSRISGGRSPYTYEWTAGGSAIGQAETLSVSAPGVYTLTVTGANGCQSAANITVQQDIEPPVVTIPAPEELTCSKTEVGVTAAVTGGRAPYSYTWTDVSNHLIGQAEEVLVSTPGVYSVTVIGANGCQSWASVAVKQDIEPPVVAIPAPDVLSCAATEVTLLAATAGGRAPYTYVWTNTVGQPLGTDMQLVVETPGLYAVTVTGANGCESSANVTVQQDIAPPVVSIPTPGELTCLVSCVTLVPCVSGGRVPYMYAWTDAAGQPAGSTPQLLVVDPGIYTLTVTGANGCETITCVTVQQDIAPPCVTVCGTQTLTCNEPTAYVDVQICVGSGPFTYHWVDDCGALIATTQDVALNFAGTYTLTVTGANGCSSSHTVEILDGINPPSVNAGPDQILACAGAEILLDATVSGGNSPYVFTWVDSCGELVGNCEDLVVTLPGIYILTVQSADGCVAMDSVTVELP
jgi:SprB-like repeat protein